ncbi:MAG: hypothetical protein AABX29_02020 [Nanoarchaeota archaeon]
MNKRGQELSLNTLIVIILLVIALVVIAVFFLGGTSSLSRSIRSIFYGTTAGTDLSLALQTCEQRCEAAKNLPATLRKQSALCTQPFSYDSNNDGTVDKKIYCQGDTIKMLCQDGSGQAICDAKSDDVITT